MYLPTFLRSQLFVTPKYPTESFAGKTVIVTGSNTGLGFEAARHIARLDCSKLILAVRTVSKGQSAKESILESTKRKDDCIEVWELDMSKSESVKAFAQRVQGLDRLDAIVENAGVMLTSFQLQEGVEQTIKVNVISTFLLALLVLPKLRETEQKYKVTTFLEIVSSEVHHFASVKQFEYSDLYAELNTNKKYDGGDRYNVSKSLEVLFVRELIKHTTPGPIITLVNPGFCHSEFQRDLTGPIASIVSFMKLVLARKTEVGSRTLVAGVCAGKDSHGQFMSDCQNQEVAGWVRSPRGVKVQKQVYEQTLAVLESIEPGISANI